MPGPSRRSRYDRIAVLAYITTYQQHHRQRSPSERQIQAALGVSAPSVVHKSYGGFSTSDCSRRRATGVV